MGGQGEVGGAEATVKSVICDVRLSFTVLTLHLVMVHL